MIKVKFDYKDQVMTGFELSGHADAGDYGHDIVCAAVSALAITTVNGLSQVANINPLVDQDSKNGGYLAITLQDNDLTNVIAQALLKSFKNGISDVASQYNDYVQIK